MAFPQNLRLASMAGAIVLAHVAASAQTRIDNELLTKGFGKFRREPTRHQVGAAGAEGDDDADRFDRVVLSGALRVNITAKSAYQQANNGLKKP